MQERRRRQRSNSLCAWRAWDAPRTLSMVCHSPASLWMCSQGLQYINWERLHTATLGAGEVLLGDMDSAGFRIAQDSEAVDCVLINTCGFVEDAKAESLQVSPLYSPLLAHVSMKNPHIALPFHA